MNTNIFIGKHQQVAKGTVLLRSGEVCNMFYRVVSGCLKSYVIDSTGKHHILQFAPEGWLISDMDSFINGKPSLLFIDAVEESEIMVISKKNHPTDAEMTNEQLIDFNQKLKNSLIASNNRLIGLLSSSAEQRYHEFTNKYPTLVQRLPLKLIASYIGITPEYLSEIRRKMAGK